MAADHGGGWKLEAGSWKLEIGSWTSTWSQFPASSFSAALVCIAILCWPPPAEAAIVRGIQEIVGGIFQLPLSILTGTFRGPPVVGTVIGAITGVVQGAGLVVHGAVELVASGVSIAKTVAPYVLPFVL